MSTFRGKADGGAVRESRDEKPLAVRPQRQWAVRDAEEALRRLPARAKAARAWYARFIREAYAVDAKAVREGLHADRLKPEHVARLPARVRRWWGRQLEFWPARATQWAAEWLGVGQKELDSTLRRGLYVDQNAATRDVYSLGRVQPLEEGEL